MRWTIPFAGFLLALMAGLMDAWGVFVVPLVERFGWTTAEAMLPFTVFMVVFAIAMVPAGRLQDKWGPRKVAALGAVLFFIAYGGAALIGQLPYLWWLVLVNGFLGGIGCGLIYACVAPPARKWYPDKPGLAISFGMMGAGLAAVVLAPLKADILIPRFDIEGTFLILAILVLVVSLFGVAIIKNPPEGWMPPKVVSSKTILIREEVSPRRLPRNPLFWIIWLTFVFVFAGGFMCLGLIPAFGEKVVGLTPGEAALAIAIFAGFNGFGRPLAGVLSDRFGAVSVMIGTYIIQAITLLSFHVFAVTLPTLFMAAALLGWGFAVTLVVFPVLTSICFGIKNLGMNYGLVFTASGVGAFAPFIGGWLFDITRSYTPAFVLAGIAAVLGLVLCVVLRKKYKLA